jgi:hypothetical protein
MFLELGPAAVRRSPTNLSGDPTKQEAAPHRSRMLDKLNLRNNCDLTRFAIRRK